MESEGEDVAKFNIMWKSYSKVFLESASKLLVTGQFADVTLVCEGQRIKCHRVILSTFSSHLAQLLEDLATPDPVICLGNGIKFNHLQSLVTFMYNGGIEVAQEDIPGVLKAAEELKVKGLSSSDRPDPPVEEMVADEDEGGQVTDGANVTDVTLQSNTPEVPVVASTSGGSSLAVPVVVPLNVPHDSQVAIPNQIGDCGRKPEEMADEESSTLNDDDAGSLGLGTSGNGDGTHPIPKETLKQQHLATKAIAKKPHLRKPAILSLLSGMANAQSAAAAAPPHVRTGKKKSKRPRVRKAGVPPQPSPFGENMKNAIEMVKSGWGLSRASKEFKIPISTLSKYYKDPERLKTSKMYYFN